MQKPEQKDFRDDKRCGAVHDMHQDNKYTEVTTQEFDVERSKVFNLRYAETRAERLLGITKDAELFMTHTKTMNTQR